jgi:hypothetical protein
MPARASSTPPLSDPLGEIPQAGVWDPSRARVPGRHKSRISQRLRESRAAHFPDRRCFYNGLAGRGLGIVRLFSAAEIRPKPLRNGRESPQDGVAATIGSRLTTHPKAV